MSPAEDTTHYIERVLHVLTHNPTAADLDFLVEAFARVGSLAATAETLAEKATHARKHAEALRFLEAKATRRMTEREATMTALTDTVVEHHAELDAIAKAKHLRNLLDAIEQAINAVKHLSKLTGGY